MTAQRTRKILRFFGYMAFFLVCFVVSLVITFPYDRLNHYAEAQVEKALGWRTSIESIRPTLLGNVRVEGVTLGPALSRPGQPAPDSTTPYVLIDDAVVSLSYLGLLFGSVDVEVDGHVADGDLEVDVEQNEEHLAFKVKLLGARTKRIPIIREKVGLPVTGALNLDLDFDVPTGAANEATGAVNFALTGGVVGDGQAKLSISSLMGYGRGRASSSDEGRVIQPIKLGAIGIQSKMVKGVMEIPRVDAESEHVELSLEGRVKMGEPIGQTRIDTYITVKLLDAYAETDAATGALVSAIDMVGRPAKRADGALGFRISGTVQRGMSFRPSKTFSLPGARRSGRNRPDRASRGAARRRPPRPRPRPGIQGNSPARRSVGPDSPSSVSPRLPRSPGASSNNYPSGMPRRSPPPPPTAPQVTPTPVEQYPQETDEPEEVEETVEETEEEVEETEEEDEETEEEEVEEETGE